MGAIDVLHNENKNVSLEESCEYFDSQFLEIVPLGRNFSGISEEHSTQEKKQLFRILKMFLN